MQDQHVRPGPKLIGPFVFSVGLLLALYLFVGGSALSDGRRGFNLLQELPEAGARVSSNARPAISDTFVFTVWMPVVNSQPSVRRLAFVSDRPSPQYRNEDIYTVRVDGTGLANLSNNPNALDLHPTWSPDGTKVAFTSYNYDTRDYAIYLATAEGQGLTLLRGGLGWGGTLVWSPDGTKLALDLIYGGDVCDVYVINADGTALTRLTTGSACNSVPSWSPDSTQLAYSSYQDSASYVYVVKTDGSELTNLTAELPFAYVSAHSSAWSPDGTKIVFVALVNDDFEICLMNADGTGLENLTHRLGWDDFPAWSPDGDQIAFTAFSSSHTLTSIALMNADGSGLTHLNAPSPNWRGNAVWSPDGSRIAYVDYDGRQSDIYVMKVDGTSEQNVTNNPFRDGSPVWQP